MLAASPSIPCRRMSPVSVQSSAQWIPIVADAAIATSYFVLPAAMVYFARRRPDLTLRPMFWLLGAFIVAAGLTHVMDIVTTFLPQYRLEDAVKVVTAVAGVACAIAIWPMMPRALALPSTQSLKDVNAFLQQENARRRDAEHVATEAKVSLEQRVAERTNELARSNDELHAFSYTISHDLRAPLRAINGFAAIMREEESARLSDDGTTLLGKIERNAARMGQLIDGLLEFSRLARAESSRDDVDMGALARGVIADLREEFGSRSPQVVVDTLPVVKGDAAMLRQAWINLLSNAFKFSSRQAAPRVSISATSGDGEITYHVMDNGVGFDMAYANTLFNVFSRLHANDTFPGVGVGLAIVRRIVERHGGRVRAESWPGEGTTFHFTLPKAAAAAPLRALS